MLEFFTYTELRNIAKEHEVSHNYEYLLSTHSKSFNTDNYYEFFLSHSYRDAEIIYGLYRILSVIGHNTYVDWIEDPNDRSKTTPEIAERLRIRMNACKHLILIGTEYSRDSKWIPWELGYFDGSRRNSVSILPIFETPDIENRYDLKEQEYLGLYPQIVKRANFKGEIVNLFRTINYESYKIFLNETIYK